MAHTHTQAHTHTGTHTFHSLAYNECNERANERMTVGTSVGITFKSSWNGEVEAQAEDQELKPGQGLEKQLPDGGERRWCVMVVGFPAKSRLHVLKYRGNKNKAQRTHSSPAKGVVFCFFSCSLLPAPCSWLYNFITNRHRYIHTHTQPRTDRRTDGRTDRQARPACI